MMEGVSHWHLETDAENIAWLHADNQGTHTNVLSADVLVQFEQFLVELKSQKPRGLVILSDKKNGFFAGADVRAFTPMESKEKALELIQGGQHVLDQLATLPFPTACVIHGFCLGGGLELALACRYRIARDDVETRLGLPEVRLGIHPGFGGSVRLVALIGALKAMDLMLTGRTVSGRQAARLGVVDHAVPDRQLRTAAVRMIKDAPKPHRPAFSERLTNQRFVRPLLASVLRRQVRPRAREEHYPAPYALIDLWLRHADSPHRMMAAEAESVAGLITGQTAQNLVRCFFLQERLKSLGRDAEFPARHVDVVGAGVMGGDIAAWCALRGVSVTLQDQSPERIAPAIGRAASLFQQKLKVRHKVTEALDRLMPDHRGMSVEKADVVIEAIFEDRTAKQDLYRALEPRLKDSAILATNTSSIPLEELAPVLARPERLVGLHFFNPVAKMQLVEVVRGTGTDQNIVDKAVVFTRAIDRLPLPVISKPGFLVNRILMPYLLEAVVLESEGVPAPIIDQAARRFGMPMGPVELADTVGLDVCLHVARILCEQMDFPVPERLERLVGEGRLGRKSGSGFYEYHKGKPIRKKIPGSYSPPVDLIDRMVLRMVNESVACLREGVVADNDLLDAGMVYGSGFAPFRGGPLHYVDETGAARLKQRLEELQERHGPRFSPDPGWEHAKEGWL